MKWTEVFIRRPVLAIVVNLIIAAIGYRAIQNMPIRLYPQLESAVIKITTPYIGANSDLVRGFVTTPIEKAVASADGIDYVNSMSQQGLSTVEVHLLLNADTNAALTQVTGRVNEVRRDLPPEAEASSIAVERAGGTLAAMYLTVKSTQMNPRQVTDYLTRNVLPGLQSVQGVQRAETLGARNQAMRIWLKPDRLAGYGLTAQDVQQALIKNNYLAAIGSTKGQNLQLNLVANTDLHSREQFARIPVVVRGNAIVRLSDVADIEIGAETYQSNARYMNSDAVFIGIYMVPGANALTVGDAVLAKIAQLNKAMPAGMTLDVGFDNNVYIKDALRGIAKTLTETLLIVSLVIYLFMGSVRSVVVPLVAMPISLLGAASIMVAFGFSINLLTILAIVLSVGLVVDDAIVVAENVERHMGEGMSPIQAAIKGVHELTGPIIAMTVTLAVVYAPIGFQSGLTGILFREFAFTLAAAVVISGIVALTLSPVMSAKMLRPQDHRGRLAVVIDRNFERLKRGYARGLDKTLHSTREVVFVAAVFMILIPPFYMFSGKELAPVEDEGLIFSIMSWPSETTQDYDMLYAADVAHRLLTQIPETEAVWQVLMPGFGGTGLVLKPWSQRKRTAMQILPDVQHVLSGVSGIVVFPGLPPALPGAGDFDIEFIINGDDTPTNMAKFAHQLAEDAVKSGLFMFADADVKVDQPQTSIVIEREKVAALGLDMRQVGADLSALMGGNYVNRFSLDGRSYKVIPQIERQKRLNPEQLRELYISGPDNRLIPLSSIAHLETTVEPRVLQRFQQRDSIRIFGGVMPGNTKDAALQFMEQKSAEILPPGYGIDYAGEARQLRHEGQTLNQTLIFAVLLIYLVLAAQFGSFRDPLIILLGSAPLAIAGALLFTFLGVTTINIYSQVGLITLVGLVSKNGILIVEFANKLQEMGRSKAEAVREAALTRLRPILITSAATAFGHVPLVLVTGAGAAARNSIGYILVTGMMIGSLFTLFIVPTLYLLVAHDLQKKHPAESEKAAGQQDNIDLGANAAE